MIHLDYRDGKPLYGQIADRFRQQIRSGILLPGERMPSVRELAAELTINPNTIQRAYRELESSGWIVSVTGKGSFVAPQAGASGIEPLLAELDWLTAALLEQGMTRQALAQHILKGDNDHA